MNEYDCLLLEFVFGNRPDDAQKVRAYVLETIASDPGLQQTELVFLGLFGRSCRILESKDQQVHAQHVLSWSKRCHLEKSLHACEIETIASDPGFQQTELVFLGIFGRSRRILESKDQQVFAQLFG